MKEWMKGTKHPSDAVDFQTKKSLYEVKSCKLLLEGDDGSGTLTHKLGRFYIVGRNHDEIYALAKKENKRPKYLFALRLGKHLVWKTFHWGSVEMLRKDYFGESYYDEDFDRDQPFLLRVLDVFKEMGE